uniref:GCF C-terminal domain-containing protein n=1 Tax=Chromera velia CCMP2878 TaxID=1169474 RepID=A0A0G4GUH2_9ALVE|eukprot:Cvel_23435.t1-p1 / transcript=Cvel_23435.t1 / gene=Cvel_23435 / organism=Chromera_velia_CCMP2878 / gene_product=GC-rich sequence DNA-binding factor 2, putative / transcript_product=GC-rich sequence DNA-binding factor 2, putative / location=Cvel_scaffold2415:8085-13101(+) / protein_length=1039 / sequence_SO=supercontig / SO=protein_coding / is_pseudo=false
MFAKRKTAAANKPQQPSRRLIAGEDEESGDEEKGQRQQQKQTAGSSFVPSQPAKRVQGVGAGRQPVSLSLAGSAEDEDEGGEGTGLSGDKFRIRKSRASRDLTLMAKRSKQEAEGEADTGLLSDPLTGIGGSRGGAAASSGGGSVLLRKTHGGVGVSAGPPLMNGGGGVDSLASSGTNRWNSFSSAAVRTERKQKEREMGGSIGTLDDQFDLMDLAVSSPGRERERERSGGEGEIVVPSPGEEDEENDEGDGEHPPGMAELISLAKERRQQSRLLGSSGGEGAVRQGKRGERGGGLGGLQGDIVDVDEGDGDPLARLREMKARRAGMLVGPSGRAEALASSSSSSSAAFAAADKDKDEPMGLHGGHAGASGSASAMANGREEDDEEEALFEEMQAQKARGVTVGAQKKRMIATASSEHPAGREQRGGGGTAASSFAPGEMSAGVGLGLGGALGLGSMGASGLDAVESAAHAAVAGLPPLAKALDVPESRLEKLAGEEAGRVKRMEEMDREMKEMSVSLERWKEKERSPLLGEVKEELEEKKKEGRGNAERRLEAAQSMLEFVQGLAGLHEAKRKPLEQAQGMLERMLTTVCQRKWKRRVRDVDDEAREFGWRHLAACESDGEQEEREGGGRDAMGRDAEGRKGAKEAARRLRASRRQRRRQKRRVKKERKGDEGESGWDSTASSEADGLATLREDRQAFGEAAGRILKDVSDEYGNAGAVLEVFAGFKGESRSDYYRSFASASLDEALELYVQHELLSWDPLALCVSDERGGQRDAIGRTQRERQTEAGGTNEGQLLRTGAQMDGFPWYESVFAFCEDASQCDRAEDDLLPNLIERCVVPVATFLVETVWDPSSLKETERIVAVVREILEFLREEGEGGSEETERPAVRRLLKAVEQRVLTAMKDLFVLSPCLLGSGQGREGGVSSSSVEQRGAETFRSRLLCRLARILSLVGMWEGILWAQSIRRLVIEEGWKNRIEKCLRRNDETPQMAVWLRRYLGALPRVCLSSDGPPLSQRLVALLSAAGRAGAGLPSPIPARC